MQYSIKCRVSCILLLVFAILAASHVTAATCVKVRDANWDLVCVKFSEAELSAAKQYGLRLGAPYKDVKRKLTKSGWRVDQAWLADNRHHPDSKDELVCGEGYDAVCSAAYLKAGHQITLYFSGTNTGTPLIGIEAGE